MSNAQLSTLGSGNHAFDPKLRRSAWLLAEEEFSGTPTLLRGFYDARLDKGRIAALTIEALMKWCKSPAPTCGVLKNASGLIQFFIDTRGESDPGITLTGDTSVGLLRDYIESVSDCGRTVPGAPR